MSKWNDFQKQVNSRNLDWSREKISAEYEQYKANPQAYEFPAASTNGMSVTVHVGQVASAIGRDIASVNYAAHNSQSVADLSGREWPVHEWLDTDTGKFHVPQEVWKELVR